MKTHWPHLGPSNSKELKTFASSVFYLFFPPGLEGEGLHHSTFMPELVMRIKDQELERLGRPVGTERLGSISGGTQDKKCKVR